VIRIRREKGWTPVLSSTASMLIRQREKRKSPWSCSPKYTGYEFTGKKEGKRGESGKTGGNSRPVDRPRRGRKNCCCWIRGGHYLFFYPAGVEGQGGKESASPQMLEEKKEVAKGVGFSFYFLQSTWRLGQEGGKGELVGGDV